LQQLLALLIKFLDLSLESFVSLNLVFQDLLQLVDDDTLLLDL
jgi:hypothetical protein